jgi:TolB-like protein
MKTRMTVLILALSVGSLSCASTSSVMVHPSDGGPPKIAILPLTGNLGVQASDMIAERLAMEGIATVERGHLDEVMREVGFKDNAMFDQSSLPEYGKLLGVKVLLTGSVTSSRGLLSSYAHVFITLKAVDVATGKVTWIGRYGNSKWSSATSTQGDLERGAKDIVREFIKSHGRDF